ncbi:cytochrome-c peroxidase [Methylobacterium symbioticum]|uniref:Methylamine utilization protein MauG n=1 Tax=Methylobacterium symbioticum TaxID=2584084 RepID=A0A509EBS2_9HYPH|nr:cytochrome c peroxidase [Methylobacterium symbioticum]VUD71074.1 Cytochrome c551 peroxidase [Methylobacterium symbioticum]
MAWKIGTAAAVALVIAGVASSALPGPPVQRAAWREEYRTPAAIPFPEDNPYSAAKAELGRRLFFDPILSIDRNRSCATCHVPDLAWADGRPRAQGRHGGDLDLHTPSLLNLAWQDGPMGWDGKFQNLESVPFGPITASANMGLSEAEAVRRLAADPGYASAFAAAFPDAAVTRPRIEAALATFERLIVAAPASFDRWIAGDERAISESAKRGFDLFNGRANCAACHSGWSFSDGSFHDIGVGRDDDLGRGRLKPNSVALRYAFKTPTLRNVDERGSYMHDGSLRSLEAVIDLYDRGGIDRPSRSREIRPLSLSPDEKADLLAFLQTLTSGPSTAPVVAELTETPPRP